MAHPLQMLRLPTSLQTLRHRPPRALCHARVCAFSCSSSPLLFPKPTDFMVPNPPQPPQRSVSGQINDISADQIPEDFGLLENTFIMPTGPSRPSIIFPRDRLALEWRRIRYKFMNMIGLGVYRFYPKKHQRPHLRMRQIAPTAATMHQQLYTAFAANDPEYFRPLLTSNLYNKFRSRLSARPRGQTCQWTLHSYTKPVRTVSDRAARLPIADAFVRQAIVRVWANQSLEKWDAKGKLIPGSDEVREVREWVVLQKRVLEGREYPWVIWGTVGQSQIGEMGEVSQS